AAAVAAVTAMIAQLAISAFSQMTQIGIVRFVPARRRRAAWMGLRLLASLSLALMWMMGTWALRTPDLGRVLAPLVPVASRAPGAVMAGPLAACVAGWGAGVALRLFLLAAAAVAALALAAWVARQAAARGWEEAGAASSWAEARRAAHVRRAPLTAAT